MDPKFAQMGDVTYRLFKKGEIWTVHHEDLKNVTNNGWDLIFENIKYCDIYRLIYSKYDWCMNNVSECVYHEHIIENLWGNSIPIMYKAKELFDIIMTNDDCYEDEKILAEISQFFEDLGSEARMISGFNGKYDKTA